jgi:hypothetical protein
MDRQARHKALYDEVLALCEQAVGPGITSADQLTEFMSGQLGDLYRGTLPIDEFVCSELDRHYQDNECCIFNNQTGRGEHWVACVGYRGRKFIYDSFDRAPAQYVQAQHGRSMGGRRDIVDLSLYDGEEDAPDQMVTETNCGARACAFCITCRIYPITPIQLKTAIEPR